jgi:hypothetical protein
LFWLSKAGFILKNGMITRKTTPSCFLLLKYSFTYNFQAVYVSAMLRRITRIYRIAYRCA